MTHDIPDSHDSPEAIRKELRRYVVVFVALACLTAVTVLVCFGLKLPAHQAIAVALAIAMVKGSLVACFFMHLLSERKLIYAVLALTAAFFALLLWLPVHDVVAKFTY